jgi:O-antigen/teichoic acid export membrane protein
MKSDLKSQTTPAEPQEPKDKESNRRSLGRRAGLALFWNIVFLPVKAVMGLVVSLVIIKLFIRDKYADLAVVTGLLTMLGLLTDLGIERALPRFVGELEVKHGRTALRRFIFALTIVKLAVLAAVAIFFVLGSEFFLSVWFPTNSQGKMYLSLILILLVLGAFYDIATQVLYGFFKQKVTNLLDIVVSVLNPLMTMIFILWFKMDVYGVMLALLITTFVSVIIATWQAWLASKEAHEPVRVKPVTNTLQDTSGAVDAGQNPGIYQQRKLWWRFTKYASLMYFFNLSTSFYDSSFAVLVLTFYKEATAAVIIRVVYSFIKTLLKNLLAPFNGVQTPLFSSIQAEGKEGALGVAYSSLSKLQIFILVPSALGMIILARNLLELLMLRQSADAVITPDVLPSATWAVILTVIFTFAEAIISMPLVILMVYEKYRSVILSRLLPLLTGPMLVLVALFNWGVIAAVVVMGVVAVGSRLIALLIVQRDFKLFYPMKFFWKVLRASLAFGIPLQIAVLLLPVNWIVTASVAVAGVIIFGLTFKFLGGFDPEDKKRLLTLKLPFRHWVVKYL